MKSKQFHYPIQVYYEDTDHSGVVYHANYLKYFERAREHLIGVDELVRLWKEEGLGFAVYKVEIGYFDGAEFGEQLDIRTRIEKSGDFRLICYQEAWRPDGDKAAVSAVIQMVCLDKTRQLRPIPVISKK